MDTKNLKFTDETVELVEFIGEKKFSNTQSIKTLIIEKDGKRFISLQKWWRESTDEPWKEGKGFHLKVEEAKGLINDLDKALNRLA
ncbi:hypothetical protein [Aneurinibacillus aneurinilyticus]|uniref:Transcriptional coactivator p15 (PC4) C-terminal domain-containing protein n=1 Tax=Aneurinibacillus aneurinilyticus TaxID=1391 RepID=A0A848D3L5_ANEAE|nr:hypothetical protein [Aneurinibacillus aneurinilyticus]NMF01390.1 hypothetical protein [Aneurinibacillus aneurinilyticus]